VATLTSKQAIEHLNEMDGTLTKLTQALTDLTTAGNKVKQSWHGQSAEQFQSTWQTYRNNFDQLQGDMKKLHTDITTINNNIASSGGGYA
jgi:WXG100 family type VII secretion target